MSGLEVYRQNGTVRFNLSSRPYNFFGYFDTGVSNGSFAIPGLTAGGRPNWWEKPLSSFNDRIPTITLNGNVLSWTFKDSGQGSNCQFRVYYGEW